MKTILVLSSHPDFAETVRTSLNPERYRVVHRLNVEEAEPLLIHNLAAACVLDVDLMDLNGVWAIERLRRLDSRVPVIAYSSDNRSEWEDEAFQRGATQVLTKPVRGRLLNSLLARLDAAPALPSPVSPASAQSAPAAAPADFLAPGRLSSASPTLDVLRDFSSILTHSLNADAMLRQFLQFLREILSINRAAIFINRPLASAASAAPADECHRLRVVSAIGISPGLLEHFELSLDAGIGAQLVRLGRILRRHGDEARADVAAQKEFELLGAQVAVPIPGRDGMVGVAVFDGRITGEPLVNVELELIFHLLEQVGLALCNISLHDQLAGNHEMMADVLRELSSACVVVSRDLKVLHANKAARRHFGPKPRRAGEFEFSDLPQLLGARIYQVLKTGAGMGPFRYEAESSPGTVYSISIVPFQRGNSTVPVSALLVADDLSQTEQLRRLEVEAANLRLIKSMSDRLAHEIGNALVPLATHQQLLAEKYRDREFRESLDQALADGVKRVNRLINQMRFLAREGHIEQESFPVRKLIEDAYQEARKHQSAEAAKLQFDPADPPVVITGDRAALKHALAEIMLNALQANPREPRIGVKLHADANSGRKPDIQIEVQDNGAGFTAEAAQKAPAPFFTTRNVGLGLGLTVSRKIIETHHGKLEIVPPSAGHHGVVRVSLPADAGTTTPV